VPKIAFLGAGGQILSFYAFLDKMRAATAIAVAALILSKNA
jgi:hypothetical protein